MGFSVSGSAAIIFVGMFVAFGMWHSATTGAVEQVSTAQQLKTDNNLEQQNAAIEITSLTYDPDSNTLTVDVENTGAEQLHLSDTDVIIDGNYETNWQSGASVGPNTNTETDLWLPDEELTATFDYDAKPSRVKVVSEHAVSDTEVTN